ncbi:hypothetical protein BCL74_3675 [Oceanibaculum indicum]|uniref:Uncharacterized protein n=2 Tax=Oceanibaculum indicum TaxID=526216 RepID=A0A420WA20_9PROT|nr:hypothetical protein BCL74_3675 [Oceanibaculum indicum]
MKCEMCGRNKYPCMMPYAPKTDETCIATFEREMQLPPGVKLAGLEFGPEGPRLYVDASKADAETLRKAAQAKP